MKHLSFSNYDGNVLTIKALDHDYQHTIEVSNNNLLKEVFTVKGQQAIRWSERILE